MNRRILSLLNAAAMMAAVFGSGCEQAPPPPLVSPDTQTSSASLEKAASPIATTVFLDDTRLRVAWKAVSDQKQTIPGAVVAGVVNHHVLASDLLAGFFHAMKQARPDATRFIVLSPDHYNVGRGEISTHLRSYLTPEGEVFTDVTSTRTLIQKGFATEEPGAMFEKEHGVGALVPFLRHEFPDARILSFTVNASIPVARAEAFGRALREVMDEHTVVIVSSDMSHYLSESIALRNDLETETALKTLNTAWFAHVTDDFTDNGKSFVALRAALDADRTTLLFTELGHSISSRYGGPPNNTTSYFTGVWSVR